MSVFMKICMERYVDMSLFQYKYLCEDFARTFFVPDALYAPPDAGSARLAAGPVCVFCVCCVCVFCVCSCVCSCVCAHAPWGGCAEVRVCGRSLYELTRLPVSSVNCATNRFDAICQRISRASSQSQLFCCV